MPVSPAQAALAAMQEQFMRASMVAASARPILGHLLANETHSLFADEVIARIRGMVNDLAGQLLAALARAGASADEDALVAAHGPALAARLCERPAFLLEAHALTLEARLAERFCERSDIDPVLTPLLQDHVASPDPAVAAQAMQVLAAQARFMQSQRRMRWPLAELPPALLAEALSILEDEPALKHQPALAQARRAVQESYSEGATRIARLIRLLLAVEGPDARALALDHAGVAIFVSALALALGWPRRLAVLALIEGQAARLLLGLRAAGVPPAKVSAQMALIHPGWAGAPDPDLIAPEDAKAILVSAEAGEAC